MSTTPTPAPQSEASKIIGLIYSLGIAAAAIFVKNANHQQTASNIVTVLNAELPNLEGML